MKIKNEYIQIEIGNKTYTKRNMILDEYVKRFFKGQIYPDLNYNTNISSCFLKLDTPLENISYDSVLHEDDFDITFFGGTANSYVGQNKFINMTTRTDNSVVLRYTYKPGELFTYRGQYFSNNEFEMFKGRKIATIGFGLGDYVFAVADVSNMNIVINTNEEIIVNRVDKLQSDGICDGFEYPLHLVNFSSYYDIKNYNYYDDEAQEMVFETQQVASQLYSIGLGNIKGLMETEHIIDFSQTTITNDSIKITFSDLIKVGHYPSEDLALGFYPTLDNSKYLILKYRLYKISSTNEFRGYLDQYYTMSIPVNLAKYEGQTKTIEFELKVERL